VFGNRVLEEYLHLRERERERWGGREERERGREREKERERERERRQWRQKSAIFFKYFKFRIIFGAWDFTQEISFGYGSKFPKL
jgi:hypothetical protein